MNRSWDRELREIPGVGLPFTWTNPDRKPFRDKHSISAPPRSVLNIPKLHQFVARSQMLRLAGRMILAIPPFPQIKHPRLINTDSTLHPFFSFLLSSPLFLLFYFPLLPPPALSSILHPFRDVQQHHLPYPSLPTIRLYHFGPLGLHPERVVRFRDGHILRDYRLRTRYPPSRPGLPSPGQLARIHRLGTLYSPNTGSDQSLVS